MTASKQNSAQIGGGRNDPQGCDGPSQQYIDDLSTRVSSAKKKDDKGARMLQKFVSLRNFMYGQNGIISLYYKPE